MNGGVEVASTNSCEAGSSTTAVLVVTAIISSFLAFGSGSHRQHRRLHDQVDGRLGLRDGNRMGCAWDLDCPLRTGAVGHEALERRGDVAVLLGDQEPRPGRDAPQRAAGAGADERLVTAFDAG
jgi:hypothetical protein